jgi:hypothetical protein
MHMSAKALLAEIIDYAGLFPPARLPLEEAFERYLEHRRGPSGWLLARFVCPAGRLEELATLLANLDDGEPVVPLAVLGRGGETGEAFRTATAADLESVGWFLEKAHGRARCDQLEARLPPTGGPATLGEVVRDTQRLTRELGEIPPTAYFEASLLGDWKERVPAAVEAVADSAREGTPVGLKIRCGGADAAAVPTTEAVVAALAACRDAGIPLKATQGLHHPLRHVDPVLEVAGHGFLNLFVAGLLARRHGLDAEALATVIADDDPADFTFSDSEVHWRELTVDVAAIREGRQRAVTSFGSCSFSEPHDHLRDMGLVGG